MPTERRSNPSRLTSLHARAARRTTLSPVALSRCAGRREDVPQNPCGAAAALLSNHSRGHVSIAWLAHAPSHCMASTPSANITGMGAQCGSNCGKTQLKPNLSAARAVGPTCTVHARAIPKQPLLNSKNAQAGPLPPETGCRACLRPVAAASRAFYSCATVTVARCVQARACRDMRRAPAVGRAGAW